MIPAEELNNTKYKLQHQEKINIGYIGGSITQGDGSSDPSQFSWRARTTAWFENHYPHMKFTEINASVSGTGSDFAAFRCKNDLLKHKPDLVFIEFAVNDGTNEVQHIMSGMEGIIRQIYHTNPFTDIVLIYTMNRELAEKYRASNLQWNALKAGKQLADYYHIPQINIGEEFWKLIQSKKETWNTLTGDGTHPTDKGYGIYYSVVEKYLKECFSQESENLLKKKEVPAPLSLYPMDKVAVTPASEIKQVEDWNLITEMVSAKKQLLLVCNKPGNILNLESTGRIFGLMWVIDKDSGMISVTVDGKKEYIKNSYDEYALLSRRINYFTVDDLSDGMHEVKIQVLPEHDKDSTGTFIRIGAFLEG